MTAAAPTIAEVLAALALADARAGRRPTSAEPARPATMPAEIVVRVDGEPLPFEVAR